MRQDSTYYAPAVGRTGTALRTSLHDIIDDSTKLSYDAVWTALKDTDQDPANSANVIELGGDGFTDLEMSSTVGTSSSRIGDLETLLAWSAADPVDAFEMRRNDRIHAQWQGNRNPFVDHPEWAAAIWN